MTRAIKVQGMAYTEFIGGLIEKALQRKDGEIGRKEDREMEGLIKVKRDS
jgi:hypothetical protein